jgi:hypothetical protein
MTECGLFALSPATRYDEADISACARCSPTGRLSLPARLTGTILSTGFSAECIRSHAFQGDAEHSAGGEATRHAFAGFDHTAWKQHPAIKSSRPRQAGLAYPAAHHAKSGNGSLLVAPATHPVVPAPVPDRRRTPHASRRPECAEPGRQRGCRSKQYRNDGSRLRNRRGMPARARWRHRRRPRCRRRRIPLRSTAGSGGFPGGYGATDTGVAAGLEKPL